MFLFTEGKEDESKLGKNRKEDEHIKIVATVRKMHASSLGIIREYCSNMVQLQIIRWNFWQKLTNIHALAQSKILNMKNPMFETAYFILVYCFHCIFYWNCCWMCIQQREIKYNIRSDEPFIVYGILLILMEFGMHLTISGKLVENWSSFGSWLQKRWTMIDGSGVRDGSFYIKKHPKRHVHHLIKYTDCIKYLHWTYVSVLYRQTGRHTDTGTHILALRLHCAHVFPAALPWTGN